MRMIGLLRYLTLVTLLAGTVQFTTVTAAEDKKDEGFTDLFNGKDFTGWKMFLSPKAKDADPAKTWSVKDGMIVCTGRPNGYFYTAKSYQDYVLDYDWRYRRP